MILWPRETATLLKSNLRFFHREKSTFEKFDAGLKLRIVFYTHKTIKNRRKNFRVIYTLTLNHLILIGKYFLCKCAFNESRYQFADFIALVRETIDLERYIAVLSNKTESFVKKWSPFI